jgi:transposase
MDKPITYVGLDVHKDTIAVALAEMGKRGEVREHGKIANTPAALNTLAGKLARAGAELRFCYEAGPCGYGIERQLTEAGHGCVVVAPSLIPRKPGERIKTDRRDAINLAKLHRAGELTPVWVPDPAHAAIRDLVRSLRQARQQLSGFLLRHGHHCNRPDFGPGHPFPSNLVNPKESQPTEITQLLFRSGSKGALVSNRLFARKQRRLG